MRTNVYVIFEEDDEGYRLVLDIIDVEMFSLSTVIRRARKMKTMYTKVLVYIDDNPEQPPRRIYRSRK